MKAQRSYKWLGVAVRVLVRLTMSAVPSHRLAKNISTARAALSNDVVKHYAA